MAKDPVLDTLRKAAKGLTYTSETDAPLEPFAWEGGGRLTATRVRELAGKGKTVRLISRAHRAGSKLSLRAAGTRIRSIGAPHSSAAITVPRCVPNPTSTVSFSPRDSRTSCPTFTIPARAMSV